MNIKFRHFCALSLFLMAGNAQAGILTPEQALSRMPTSTRAVSPTAAYSLYDTYTTATGTPAAYLFTSDNSSILLSADDMAIPVLGVLDSPSVPTESPEFRYWINKYAEEIEWLRANGSSAVTRSEEETIYKDIAPLLSTKWGQGNPFNNQSPKVDGKESWSGCVATAMSQVMNYHEWPKKGKGSNSYKASTANKEMFCDFSSINFNWAEMTDTYDDNSTQSQNDAVATLLYACAVSVNMDFSPDGSGAWSELVPGALVNYFDYDAGAKALYRDYYTQAEWNKIVYDQLVNYGPLYYAGSSDDGAHAFVCDGYQNGMFHINWGWNGYQDGYYRLSALYPGDQQGAGGSTGAYNFDQFICSGVQKPQSGSKMDPVILYHWGYEMEQIGFTKGAILSSNGWIMNYSTQNLAGLLGYTLVDETGKEQVVPGAGAGCRYEKDRVDGLFSFRVKLPDDLAEGTYKVYPSYLQDGYDEWIKIPVKNGFTKYYVLEVKGPSVSLSTAPKGYLYLSEAAIDGKTFVGKNITLTGKLSNPSSQDYEGVVQLNVMKENGDVVAWGKREYVNLAANETIDYKYVSKLLDSLEEGNYKVSLVNAITDASISSPISMVYEKLPDTSITLNEFYLTGDAMNANGSDLEFNLKITCDKGYLFDKIDLSVWTWPGPTVEDYVCSFSTEELRLEAGKTVEVKVKGSLPAPIIGMRYIVGAWYEGEQQGNSLSFTVQSAGVEEIDFTEVVKSEVFNLSGVKLGETSGEIDFGSYPKGIYILRCSMPNGKIKSQKIVIE